MSDSSSPSPGPSSLVEVESAPVTLFGHEPGSARLRLERRTRSWRLRKALPPLVVGLLVAPLVAVFPPHAPWAVISVVTGAFLARRRWKEEYTIRGAEAGCPRCGASLPLEPGQRLRFPHSVTCEECGHEPVLRVDRVESLEGEVG